MISVWQKQRTRVRVRKTRTRQRRSLTRYFRSAWKPAAFCLVTLLLLTLVGAMNETALLSSTYLSLLLGSVCTLGVAIALIGLVTATVWHLVNRSWLKSTSSICLLIGLCYAFNMMIANLFLFAANDAVLEGSVTTIPPAEISETIKSAEVTTLNFGTGNQSKALPSEATQQAEDSSQAKENQDKPFVQQMPAGLDGH